MSRISKYNFNIGDVFGTWVVNRASTSKRYYYWCSCSECGAEKRFNKYNLIRSKYALCRKCGHKIVKNESILRKHWNGELNGFNFSSSLKLDCDKSYWFLCGKGHNFKSTLANFNLDNCLSCRTKSQSTKSLEEILEYSSKFFSRITDTILIENNRLTVPELGIIIVFVQIDRYSNFRNYFETEEQLVEELKMLNLLHSIANTHKLNVFEVIINKNLRDNIERLNSTLISIIN